MLKDKHLDFLSEYGAKDNKRAVRRSHIKRLRTNRKSYWSNWGLTERFLGMLTHTAKICSCWMCGNPRKYYRKKSLKELSFEELDKI